MIFKIVSNFRRISPENSKFINWELLFLGFEITALDFKAVRRVSFLQYFYLITNLLNAVQGFLTESDVRYSHCKNTVTNFIRTYYYNLSQAWASNQGWYSNMGVFLGTSNASPRRRTLRVYINDVTICPILWRYQNLDLACSRWCQVTGFVNVVMDLRAPIK